MTETLTIRGLPASLLADQWVLAGPDEPPLQTDDEFDRPARSMALACLLILILLADLLFYGHALGLSLALFAWAVFGCVLLLRPRPALVPGAIVFLSALPVIEHLQALSVGFLVGGLSVASAMAWCATMRPGRLLAAMAEMAGIVPDSARSALRGSRYLACELRSSATQAGLFRSLGLPVGGSLVLLSLILMANPVLSDWVWRFGNRAPSVADLSVRVIFWCGIALIVWPFLATGLRGPTGDDRTWPLPLSLPLSLPAIGLNAQSVGIALMAFNVVLAIQTLTDLAFLWGHADLPQGMSFAEYAHRGAYPLLATAMLAGGFALATRPYLGGRRWLRGWVMAWLAQNVLLVVSSLRRLELYVDAYGLTYLRIHAAIWMALVAAGLALIAWQMLRGRSNAWLVLRCGALALVVLYVCSFVNFAALIATENLTRSERRDIGYLCALDATASAAIVASGQTLPCATKTPRIGGWRDWGFRNWRVQGYLETANTEAAVENPGR